MVAAAQQKIIRIVLQPFQDKFVFSGARYPAFVAGWGTGKTMCGIARAMKLSQSIPNNLGIIYRKEYTDLADSTIKDFERYTGLTVSAANKDVTLPNRSQILFRHADNCNIQNVNLGWAMIEQGDELPDANTWHMLTGRLRREGAFRSAWVIANTNGHDWVWELWKDNPKHQYDLHEATTLDNAANLPADYIESLKGLPERVYKRFVMNDWSIAEGLIWPEFDEARHCVNSYEIPNEWKQIISLDHGYTNPTAALFLAENYDGKVIVYAEHYAAEMFASDHAERIKAMEPFHDSMRQIIDPSCRNKTMQKNGTMYSIIDEYRDYGLHFDPGQNDVVSGINRVAEYFKSDNIVIFADKCPQLVHELKNYKNKMMKPGQQGFKEGPIKMNDHACDALRYSIMARPQQPLRKKYHNPDPATPCAGDLMIRPNKSEYSKWMGLCA